EVTGRADDVLISGGENIAPARLEAALAGRDGLGEVCVVGVPDPDWGQALVVVATLAPYERDDSGAASAGASGAASGGASGGARLAAVRARAVAAAGRAAAPQAIVVVDALPLRGPGKVDRQAAAQLAAEHRAGRGPGCGQTGRVG
ncbi:MAG: AMP-binding enzyme, partial [Cellulomonadaceae bacterium]